MPAALRPARFFRMFAVVTLWLAGNSMNAEPAAAASGIEGTVTIGPVHGGPSKLGVPDSAPLAQTVFSVETAAGTIKTFTTDERGHFKVDLPPGRYAIRTHKSGIKGRGCALQDIEVTASGFKQVHLECDSGIR